MYQQVLLSPVRIFISAHLSAKYIQYSAGGCNLAGEKIGQGRRTRSTTQRNQ